MNNILILGIVFLTPTIFVLIKTFLWNISYLEKKSFKIESFIKNYSWDLESINRKQSLNFLKFISLSLLSLLFINTLLGGIGIFLAYFIWVIEFYLSLENILRFREPKVNLLKPKTLLLVLLTILFLTLTVFILTMPFLNLEYSLTYISNPLFSIIPDFYLYLGVLAFFLLLIDILSPTLVLLFFLILLPINLLNEVIVKVVALSKLRYLENDNKGINDIKTIVILNDDYDNYLQLFLLKTLKLDIPDALNSSDNVYKQMYYLLKKKKQILVLNVSSKDINILKNINFNPDYLILSNDVNSKKLNDKVKDILDSKQSNFSKKTVVLDLTKIDININSVRYLEDKIVGELNINDSKFYLNLPNNPKLYTYIPLALSLINKLGYSFAKSVDLINRSLSNDSNVFLKGDNDIRLVNFSYSELDTKHLLNRISLLSSIKLSSKLILITNGFDINSKELLIDVVSELKNYIDIVITSNKNLYNACVNEDIECYKATKFKDFVYLTRLYSKKDDLVLIEGRHKPYMLRDLVSN